MGLRGHRGNPLIRPAEPHEARHLVDIVDRAYSIYIERIGRRPAPMDDDYDQRIRDGQVFVADEGGDIAGLIVVDPRPDHLLIENVAVDPSHQGSGIGRALMEYAEGYASERGLPDLRLYTNAAMTENLALYPHLGYREIDRRTERGFQRVYFSKKRA